MQVQQVPLLQGQCREIFHLGIFLHRETLPEPLLLSALNRFTNTTSNLPRNLNLRGSREWSGVTE
jgi:hypothetical protein